jgi:mRNA-degrading endonuclease YafQ of YafQ-DinJ toxin-antitoxin module
MSIYFSTKFVRKAKLLTKKDKSLKNSLDKQISLFETNPSHPSLKLHKLKGRRSTQYAVWIKGNLRALCIKDKSGYLFVNLVTHDRY